MAPGSLESLPESVNAAMTRQIDRLPPTVRRILRYCAVLGRSFRREILDATLEADGLVDWTPGCSPRWPSSSSPTVRTD